jgi:rsbT antagonist protein RsbS
MDDSLSGTRVPLSLVRGSLVATLTSEVNRRSLDAFRRDLLDRLRSTGARRVVVDASAVPLLDREDFEAITRLVRAASLMGARTVLAGLQAGVVSALVELGVDGAGVETALDLDHGLALLDEAVGKDGEEPDPDGREAP